MTGAVRVQSWVGSTRPLRKNTAVDGGAQRGRIRKRVSGMYGCNVMSGTFLGAIRSSINSSSGRVCSVLKEGASFKQGEGVIWQTGIVA